MNKKYDGRNKLSDYYRKMFEYREAYIMRLEQQFLYIQAGNVSLDDVCIDIRRKYKMKENEKHIRLLDK